MKSLLVINPNTTSAMTEAMVRQLRQLAPDLTIRGVTAATGHPVIADRVSFAAGAQAALVALHTEYCSEDAVLLGCFGDPGLAALRERCAVPVAGMLAASVAQAMALKRPFRIVTAGAAWEAMLREGVHALGGGAQLEGIDVLPGNGLSAARDPEHTREQVQALVDRCALARETMVLGGAGFAGLKDRLNHADHVIDGLEAALRSLLPKGVVS